MMRESLKKRLILKLQVLFALLLFGIIGAKSIQVHATQEFQPTEEEYQVQFDDAIKLADMLRTSPYLVHNKLYTAEQEVELQALVDSVCSGQQSDRDKAVALLACISEKLEHGDSYELNGWETLCDGTSQLVDQQTYCFTFYDVCRLADIPCFILEDCKGENEVNNKYICMVYIEDGSAAGKEWHFVDVMAEDGILVNEADACAVMGKRLFPMSILLDYDRMMNVMNVIFLNKEAMLAYSGKSKITPHLVYDRDTDTVKTYFRDGTLANGEQYCRTEAKVGEDGEVPVGWIETKKYSGDTVTTYLQYSLYGVFLRGRIDKDGTEYNLTGDFYDSIPYNAYVGDETESEEHKAYALEYKLELEDKAVEFAEALLEDENYIWNDIKFTEEEETLVKEAVETALDWEYITGNEWSVRAFEIAGISLDNENPDALSDKAKAQAILVYIRRNIETLDHDMMNVNSAIVLSSGGGTCAGVTLLYRDMCVMAGLPCFRLACSMDMNIGDSLFVDHANNLVKAGDEWFFLDPTFAGVMGKGTGYQAAFIEGYTTGFTTNVYFDCETMRKDNYYKWGGYKNVLDYYDFDSEGNLGIYRRNRFKEPVVVNDWILQTDENGRYLLENGLHTVDLTETSEDGMAQVVMRYAYYYQNGRLLEGDKVIDGVEYHFNMEDAIHNSFHLVGELSRRYYISKMDFKTIEDQPYDKNGVCPIPEIYHGDKKLELGKDFRIVEYKHNKELTSYTDASYQVEGIGDYMESATRYFKIVQADISNMDVKLSETSFEWTPEESYYKPEVEVDLDWQDYIVEYFDYNKVGQAKVVLTGKGNYKGSVTRYYDITLCEWNENEFKILDRFKEPLQSQEFSYNFYSVTPEAKVYWCNEEGAQFCLGEGVDYDISYSASDKPGVVTVTATAKGNYQGSLTCTYTIKEYDIGDNSGVSRLISMGDSQNGDVLEAYYTGSSVMPEIPDFEGLEEGVHYTMTVTDNVNVGTAKITLQGIGVCTGTYEIEYEIVPYVLWTNAINAEYTYTTYNGNIQKPLVKIKSDLVEGRDYFISYAKKVDGEYQETEPKEVGEYWIVIHVTDNVLIRQAGESDTDAPDAYYISYNINSDGSGSSGTGSGTGNSGSDTGNTNSGTSGIGNMNGGTSGTGSSDTGNTNTENEIKDDNSDTENTDKGNGTGDNNSGTENSDSVNKTDTNNVSGSSTQNSTVYNKAYNIKTLKLTSMKKAIKLKWTKIKKAKGYQIQISLYKNYKKSKTINVKKSKNSYTLKKLKANKKYYIRIRAYGKKGKQMVYGKWKKSSKRTK